MGRFVRALLADRAELELVAALDRDDDLARGLGAAEVALDFTVAGRGARHGHAMLEAGVRPVIGTSGVSAEENEVLDRRARDLGLGGLVVPNFSVGMVLLQRAAEAAVRHLPEAEVVELHHPGKRDAHEEEGQDDHERHMHDVDPV